jgi:hypothetical protein
MLIPTALETSNNRHSRNGRPLYMLGRRPPYIQWLPLMPDRRNHGHMTARQKKITFGEMREAGVDRDAWPLVRPTIASGDGILRSRRVRDR